MKKNAYFVGFHTAQELKAEYRRLCKLYHPDLGGDAEIMKQINTEFETVLNNLNASSDSQKIENASEFINIIESLLKLGVDVEVCGSWLWITGDTRPVKESLKELGARWAPKKKKWYIKPAGDTARRRGSMTMNQIREKYGSETYSGHKNNGSRLRNAQPALT